MPLGLFLLFFWWSLAADLRFSLGQTNTSCRRSVNSILFAAVLFTLANKRWRYATALCELDVKKGGGKGGGKAKSAEANGGERERKRHATAADIRRILTPSGPK